MRLGESLIDTINLHFIIRTTGSSILPHHHHPHLTVPLPYSSTHEIINTNFTLLLKLLDTSTKMFSFHKPKIYRSNLGCCICKAKSSSSRFTDSKKYENEFEQCFRLKEKRSGEICNACVLLVKRWKKLTPENRLTKHWHHVVDARAGPGTKLTGNRRLTSPASQQRSSSSGNGNSNNSNDTNDSNGKQRMNTSSRFSNLLPLSSNQNQANQSSPSSSKCRSLSKVCAIDTNVSTFTFGEPITNVNRTRSYMSSSNESSYHTISASSSSHSLKPQSALSSSAFESVIKRFRQRQQQQHLEAQRRKLSRQRRAQQKIDGQQKIKSNGCAANQLHEVSKLVPDSATHVDQSVKRAQRYSSTENAFGVASVLDSSIWRREKICCGIIFRGLYNEIAIVPRLLKPCQCRSNASYDGVRSRISDPIKDEEEDLGNNDATENDVLLNEDDDEEEQVPPPRATKSGSISSCDSNTSGCGSMEEANSNVSIGLTKDSKRMRSDSTGVTDAISTPRKRQRLENIKQLSVRSPGGSSSGLSSSQLAPEEEGGEDDEVDDIMMRGELVLEGDASTTDSSNDATSSSIGSLTSADLGNKQSNAVALG